MFAQFRFGADIGGVPPSQGVFSRFEIKMGWGTPPHFLRRRAGVMPVGRSIDRFRTIDHLPSRPTGSPFKEGG